MDKGIFYGGKGLSSSSNWTSHYVYLKSSDIWYRREINNAGGYFALDYSEDAGVTWTNLVTLDLTESDPLIDLAHIYRHRIVDFEYHIDQTLTSTGYAGTEGVDWENLDVRSGYWTDLLFNNVIEGHSYMTTGSPMVPFINDGIRTGFTYTAAVGGNVVADMVARQAVVDSKLESLNNVYKNILAIWIGANDIVNTAGQGTTAYNALKSYVQSRITAGWKVYIYTIVGIVGGGRGATFESERNIFNGLLRTDLALINGVYILDTDTIAELDDSTNTTYFNVDQVHLSPTGYYLASQLFINRMVANYSNRVLPLTVALPNLTITASGNGTGVSTLFLSSDFNWSVLTLDGLGKFYSDAAGTLNETNVLGFSTSGNQSIYIRCSAGVSNLVVVKNYINEIGGISNPANAPFIEGSVALLTNLTSLIVTGDNNLSGSVAGLTLLTHIYVIGANTLSGSVAGLTLLDYVDVRGTNTLSGSVAGLTSLTKLLVLGNNTLSGSVAALTSLTQLFVRGNNTLSGSVAGLTSLAYFDAIGANTLSGSVATLTSLTYLLVYGNNTLTGSMAALTSLTYVNVGGNNTLSGDIKNIVSDLTTLFLEPCGMNTYTAGATWGNAGITINPSVGFGYTSAMIDNMLIDMAASAALIGKSIFLNGSNAPRTAASNAAVATLQGAGRTNTVFTN
jgi:hypothetical protein